MEINSNHSTYGAAFRQKPIFFMSGKETVAFFEGKLKKNMTLQEDTCTLGSNDTYRRQHTTPIKGRRFRALPRHSTYQTTSSPNNGKPLLVRRLFTVCERVALVQNSSPAFPSPFVLAISVVTSFRMSFSEWI